MEIESFPSEEAHIVSIRSFKGKLPTFEVNLPFFYKTYLFAVNKSTNSCTFFSVQINP